MAAGPLPFKSVVAIAVVVVYRGMMTGNKRDCGEPGLLDRGETYESLRRDRTFNRRAGEVGGFIYAKTSDAKRQNKKSRYIYVCMERGPLLAKGALLFYRFVRRSMKKKKTFEWKPDVSDCVLLPVANCRRMSCRRHVHTWIIHLFSRDTRFARSHRRAARKNTESSPIVCFFKANGCVFFGRGGDRTVSR